MSPAFAGGRELLGRILRVIDQHVRALRELAETAVEFRNAGLVVSGIDDRTDGRIQAIAQAPLRMIEPGGRNMRSADIPLFATLDFAKEARGGHHANVHRKIGAGKLRFQHLAETVAAQMFGLKAVEMKTILRFKKRMEE